jgi:branched-chain amino acid transport system permease protein
LSKKIRRALDNAGSAIDNFFPWVPKATKHFFEEIPPSMKRFKSWMLSFRGAITFISIIGLVLFPLVTQNSYYMIIILTAMIYAILGASWDFLAGYAGQVSFGHAAFFGISGYITAILITDQGFSWIWSLICGAFVALLCGLLIGIPCLRLKGPYLALATLAFSLILFNLFMMPSFPYGGSDGLAGLPAFYSILTRFFIILGFMLFTLVFLHVVAGSRTGTILKSIRDDEICAEASGINTTKYKLLAFMISAFFAGIAGALYTLSFRAVSPAVYQPIYSFYAIIMAAIGGIATISGAVIGAFFFIVLTEILTRYIPFIGDAALLIFSIILIIVILMADMGIMNPIIDNFKKLYELIMRK